MGRSNLGGLCLGLMLGGAGRKGHHIQTEQQQHHRIFSGVSSLCFNFPVVAHFPQCNQWLF